MLLMAPGSRTAELLATQNSIAHGLTAFGLAQICCGEVLADCLIDCVAAFHAWYFDPPCPAHMPLQRRIALQTNPGRAVFQRRGASAPSAQPTKQVNLAAAPAAVLGSRTVEIPGTQRFTLGSRASRLAKVFGLRLNHRRKSFSVVRESVSLCKETRSRGMLHSRRQVGFLVAAYSLVIARMLGAVSGS